MRRRFSWALIVLLAVVAAGGTACARRDAGPPRRPPATGTGTETAVEFQTITVTRTGGVAGVSDQWVVRPDGQVAFTNRFSARSVTGTLPAERLAELRRLVTAEALWAPSTTERDLGACPDGTAWSLRMGVRTTGFGDCGKATQAVPGLRRAVEIVEDSVKLR